MRDRFKTRTTKTKSGTRQGGDLTFLFRKGRRPLTPTRGPGARARARAKYPGMFNDFAVKPTLTFHMLFKNDFLIVLALLPFPEPPRLWAVPSADILILNL